MPNHLHWALLLSSLGGASAAGLYTKSSPVLQVDAKNYQSLIAKSNHTSIVEFYAPWCGHCQNLKPAYEKAAQNLEGLANVAAINCDDEDNKPFCGQMGVQGFPTLKIVVPGKKPGKPRVEDYQGQRSAKAIVDAVVDKIPNHVKRLTDKDYESWVAADNSPKAILFTEKGTTGALLRSLAVDFLGGIQFAQIRSKETQAVDNFGITSFPTLVLLPGGDDAEPVVYEGDLKKTPMLEFLSQAATPNPDPRKKAVSSPKKSTKSSTSTKIDEGIPTESPGPEEVEVPLGERPVQLPTKAPQVDQLSTPEDLEAICLNSKSGTCILTLLPETESADSELPAPAKEAILTVSELSHKLSGHRLPFYSVPAINSHSKILRGELGLSDAATEIIAVNGRRGWWRHYSPASDDNGEFGLQRVESWVDSIRLGEGSKDKLPEGVIAEEKKEPEPEPEAEVPVEQTEEDGNIKEEVPHDEL